ncbi:ChaN family lipoprotein [Aquisalimonas asiatica]|uniref:ChaN family lipoprotein n=1 Tax=Aquisalimonas asiatica TaxID=406100 RepID=UPI003CCB9EF6
MLRLLTLGLCLAIAPLSARAACELPPGGWMTPGGEPLDERVLYRELATSQAVLLGERHDRMAHHRWQLSTLAHVRAHEPHLVLGLEMFPRTVQPVLDAWVDGELDEREFLRRSGWYEHWGFDPALYLPVLHFARMHGIPLIGLNLERPVIQRIGAEGWDAVPAAERDDVGPAAGPGTRYRERLMESFEQHAEHGMAGDAEAFVRAQLARDRAMAEGISSAREEHDGALVVALIGRGHLAYGDGVPYELADLGLDDVAVLLPDGVDGDCGERDPDLADALFRLDDARHERAAPSLGVTLGEADADGVRVTGVMPESVAAGAGLEEGDRIITAAGERLKAPAELQRIIHRQAPGTWLPLEVVRDGETGQVIARFPPSPDD